MSIDTPARSTDGPVEEHSDTARREPTRADAGEPRLLGGRLAVGVIGLGLLVIGIGWFGASGRGGQVDGATDVRAQLPYLLSGGFFGLSLVVLGAALLVVQASRLERARHDALLEARFEGLAAALGTSLRSPVPEGMVVAGSAAYHLAHCRLVDGRPGQDYVTVDVAEEMGLRPCRVCGT
jgi:hypothetical protein